MPSSPSDDSVADSTAQPIVASSSPDGINVRLDHLRDGRSGASSPVPDDEFSLDSTGDESMRSPTVPTSVTVSTLSLEELLSHPRLNAATAAQIPADHHRHASFGRQQQTTSASPSQFSSPQFQPHAHPNTIPRSSSFSDMFSDAALGLSRSQSPSVASETGNSPPPLALSSRVWIQVSNLSPSAESTNVLRQIGAHFRVHPVTIADLQAEESREKVELFPSYTFVILNSAVHPTPTIYDIVCQEETDDAMTKAGVKTSEQLQQANQKRQRRGVDFAAAPIDVPDDHCEVEITSPRRSARRILRDSASHRIAQSIFRAAGLQSSPIQLLVFPSLVLSFHHGSAQAEINDVCRRLDQLASSRMDTGQWIVHAMLDVSTSSLRPIVSDVDREVDRLEELIYALAGEQYADLLKRMGLTRRRLVALKQALKSKQSMLNSLIGRDWQAVHAAANVQTPYLRDVFDHVATMLVKVECATEVLTALQDSYLANVQLRSEKQTRQFSAVATIILPLSLITGILGMNVEVGKHPTHAAERRRSTTLRRIRSLIYLLASPCSCFRFFLLRFLLGASVVVLRFPIRCGSAAPTVRPSIRCYRSGRSYW